MGEVVYVDFQTARMSEREQFLHFLAAEMDELDFQDFIEAVNDPAAYATLDDDLQDLVDLFWQKAG